VSPNRLSEKRVTRSPGLDCKTEVESKKKVSADTIVTMHRQLIDAIRSGENFQSICELLIDGADVNATGNNPFHIDDTPLAAAIGNKDMPVASMLLSLRADPDFSTASPLILAVDMLPMAVPLLLKAGANVDRADGDGHTPLHHAVMRNDVTTARLLLEAHACTGIKNDDEYTPMGYACLSGPVEMVDLLSLYGARRGEVHADCSAYEVADRSRHGEVVHWLNHTRFWKPFMFVGAMTTKDALASIRTGNDPDENIYGCGKTQRELALYLEVASGVRDVFERAPKIDQCWSREAHHFFPDRVRERARAVLRIGALLALQPRFFSQHAALVHVWEHHVMPHAVVRFPSLRRQ